MAQGALNLGQKKAAVSVVAQQQIETDAHGSYRTGGAGHTALMAAVNPQTQGPIEQGRAEKQGDVWSAFPDV